MRPIATLKILMEIRCIVKNVGEGDLNFISRFLKLHLTDDDRNCQGLKKSIMNK
jgi:hypothetical protein